MWCLRWRSIYSNKFRVKSTCRKKDKKVSGPKRCFVQTEGLLSTVLSTKDSPILDEHPYKPSLRIHLRPVFLLCFDGNTWQGVLPLPFWNEHHLTHECSWNKQFSHRNDGPSWLIDPSVKYWTYNDQTRRALVLQMIECPSRMICSRLAPYGPGMFDGNSCLMRLIAETGLSRFSKYLKLLKDLYGLIFKTKG